MIRKAVIVVLTFGAVASAVEAARSWNEPILRQAGPTLLINSFRGTTAVLGHVDADPQAADFQATWLGFGLRRLRMYDGETNAYVCTSFGVLFPSWIAVGIAAAYPTIAFIRGPLRRWRRRRKGLCLACGYDLTGNVTGVCSECGVRCALLERNGSS